MRSLFLIFLVTALLAAAVAPARAQDVPGTENDPYVEQYDNGSLNWGEGLVTATGVGTAPPDAVSRSQARAMALRAATVVARRNLLEIIKGVQIDATTTVRNYMVEDDAVASKVQGFLQNSQVLDVAHMSDGSIEVTVGIQLRGDVAETIIPPTSFSRVPVASVESAPPSTVIVDPETLAVPPARDVAPGNTYTGLLVDAKGLDVRPAMSPRIFDQDGNEVYGSASVAREFAIQQGMAGYAKDIYKATLNDRIASKPIVVKAIEVTGKAKTDLVISNEDAARVRRAPGSGTFLEQCRVMIVLD